MYGNGFFRMKNYEWEYDGKWYRNWMHGEGKLVIKDHSVYNGKFAFGMMNGKGRQDMCNKHLGFYVGNFQNNWRFGWGVEDIPSQGLYEGNWAHDKRNGEGTLTYLNGTKFVGVFLNGKRSRGK